MITKERSTLDEQRKVYWARRSPNDLSGSDGFPGQINHGIHFGNKSVNHSPSLTRREALIRVNIPFVGGLQNDM
jgi:hypothetical protein